MMWVSIRPEEPQSPQTGAFVLSLGSLHVYQDGWLTDQSIGRWVDWLMLNGLSVPTHKGVN